MQDAYYSRNPTPVLLLPIFGPNSTPPPLFPFPVVHRFYSLPIIFTPPIVRVAHALLIHAYVCLHTYKVPYHPSLCMRTYNLHYHNR